LSHWYKRILGFFIFLDWTESHCQLPPQSKAMACYLQVERHLDPDAQKRVLSFAPGSDIFNRQGRFFVHIVLNLILPNPPFLSSRKIWIQITCDMKNHPSSVTEGIKIIRWSCFYIFRKDSPVSSSLTESNHIVLPLSD